MLRLPALALAQLIGQAFDALPEEACGLLTGLPATAEAMAYVPCRNAAASARVYTIDPRDHLRADREAAARGWEVIGVVHSHTHTEPYPSPTDVEQAPDPTWHYVIVSLKRGFPEVRSYRIVDGVIAEEPIEVVAG